jgi:hypothetical protein
VPGSVKDLAAASGRTVIRSGSAVWSIRDQMSQNTREVCRTWNE